MFNYEGRIVFITGASSGLGKQMAKGFANQGADLVITARRLDKLEEVAKELREEFGIKVLPVQCDVTDTEQVNEAVEKAIAEYGKIDVLVNNAGGAKNAAVTEMTDEEWEFTVETDLNSVFKVTRAVANKMKEKGYGRIINIASMYGIIGTNQGASPYHAAKAGVIGFTKAAAAELAPFGINVNAICPGYFATELTVATLETEGFKQYMGLTVPLARAGQEGELNAGAIFLGSEEASYVTGIALPIDGGWSNIK